MASNSKPENEERDFALPVFWKSLMLLSKAIVNWVESQKIASETSASQESAAISCQFHLYFTFGKGSESGNPPHAIFVQVIEPSEPQLQVLHPSPAGQGESPIK